MKEDLLREKDELLLQLETLKDSTQSVDLVRSLRNAIGDRIRYIDAQLHQLTKYEEFIKDRE